MIHQRNTHHDESQARIKTARRNISNLRYADDTTLVAESEEELKSLLMRVKEESERASLRLNIKKTKTMASGLITAWQIEGEKQISSSWAPKSLKMVTAVVKLEDLLAPWKKSYDKHRWHIKKQKNHFVDKVCRVKAMVFL